MYSPAFPSLSRKHSHDPALKGGRTAVWVSPSLSFALALEVTIRYDGPECISYPWEIMEERREKRSCAQIMVFK